MELSKNVLKEAKKNYDKFNMSKKKFNELLAQAKKLNPVRCNCGHPASVKIHFAFYGPVGVRCECNKCERVGPMQSITTAIGTHEDGDKFATPVTERSLIKGIKSATRAWNIALVEERIGKYLNEYK